MISGLRGVKPLIKGELGEDPGQRVERVDLGRGSGKEIRTVAVHQLKTVSAFYDLVLRAEHQPWRWEMVSVFG